MAQYLNGSKPLPNHIGVEIYDLVVKLEHLTKLADPLPLTFKNEVLIRELLNTIDDEHLIIHVEDRSVEEKVSADKNPIIGELEFEGSHDPRRSTIQCRIVDKHGVRCSSVIELPDDQITDRTAYRCSHHPRTASEGTRSDREFIQATDIAKGQ
jgi:hypothetical protein